MPSPTLQHEVEPRTLGPDVSEAAPSSPWKGWLSTASTDSRAADLGLLLLRVFTGLSLALAHGIGKIPPSEGFISGVVEMGLPAPVLFAWLAVLAESVGGLLLAVGLLTRPAAFLILGNMVVIVLLAHAGDPFLNREKPALFAMVALLYLLMGAGKYSLDAWMQRRSR